MTCSKIFVMLSLHEIHKMNLDRENNISYTRVDLIFFLEIMKNWRLNLLLKENKKKM
jgi:hypothetical protein